MVVPPSVEVLHLGPAGGGQRMRLVLPPGLRELHINLDEWEVDEVR